MAAGGGNAIPDKEACDHHGTQQDDNMGMRKWLRLLSWRSRVVWNIGRIFLHLWSLNSVGHEKTMLSQSMDFHSHIRFRPKGFVGEFE